MADDYASPTTADSTWLYAEHPDRQALGELNYKDFGKWCITRSGDKIDCAWRRVRSLVASGHVVHAKVSGRWQAARYGGSYLICVYTPRWYDELDVMRVRALLRDQGFAERLGYKRDMDTVDGISGGAKEWWYQA
jgi:hypothetical protein